MAIEAGLVLFFVFVVLLVLGMPIAISIAFSSMMTLLLVIPFDVSAFSSAQKMVGSINSFSLIAIPFFVLSGIIMNNGFCDVVRRARAGGFGSYECVRECFIWFHL